MNNIINRRLMDIYDRLYEFYGPQHWWPAEGHFEVMVGAILTQAAAWTNVKKAIIKLKKAVVLKPARLRAISSEELAALIHACGYYNMKARKLKALAEWLGSTFYDSVKKMREADITWLRGLLLEVYGVGEETADSILLYACDKPVFVIDAYTRRIVDRLGFNITGGKYPDYQNLFMKNLSWNVQLFNEYHALLVALGKNHCRKVPVCRECCLLEICKKK
jgi:endonuclease-3 related protein